MRNWVAELGVGGIWIGHTLWGTLVVASRGRPLRRGNEHDGMRGKRSDEVHDTRRLRGDRDQRAPGRAEGLARPASRGGPRPRPADRRSEEHTSELQSQSNLVCRLLLEKKKK